MPRIKINGQWVQLDVYEEKPTKIAAKQNPLQRGIPIYDRKNNRVILVRPGEWLCINRQREMWKLSDEEFNALYAEVTRQ